MTRHPIKGLRIKRTAIPDSGFPKAAVLLTALLVAGCATMPESTPPLDEARAAYDRARANPEVLRHANDVIDRAGATLAEAANADDVDEMDGLAYIANTQVLTAEAIASRQLAEIRIRDLSRVKERVQLEVREAEAATAREELQRSREQLAALQAKQTERGTVVTLGNVLFEVGKAQLLPGAMSTMQRLAEYLRTNGDATVLVEGHTDSTGSDELNMRLSRARAESVRGELITRNIDASRITVAGLGPSQPVASNSTAAGRQQNRRVEIIIQ